ncbi:formamidopyrimidine-DNA glycosylase Fpg [Xenococcus sp. PCC 7305]|uniref:DNA-formamidopyrimidine glycosylase n=1 Tax=Xenococcus sp. PCC 7305 TaxID=102125 RepID=UPI0002ABA2B9|nr:DNA-formamidopyrimidine glycosylase [Xenococcus sp. PCC 7305]ELS01547.1 formamidopyrimidine-DNA glycosylase Fpg [Xenococcus sp. PCC 7305]
MPELPEVETVRRGLDKLTTNQFIEGSAVLLPRTVAYPLSVAEFDNSILGAAIASWQRRGKYLIAELIDKSKKPAGYLGVHLRMTGQLLWLKQSEPLQKHTRVRLFFPGNQELRFVDTRTFGKFWLVPPASSPETIITGLQKLGPEPFATEFTSAYLAAKLSKRRRNIKTLLLDQNIVAGIGNIYADETLFKSQIRPETLATDLTVAQIDKLHAAIIEVLEIAIAQGGTTFSDFLNLLGVNGNYGNSALVYGRQGEPCRVCNTPIEKIKLGGRSSHFCPKCQE